MIFINHTVMRWSLEISDQIFEADVMINIYDETSCVFYIPEPLAVEWKFIWDSSYHMN